MKLTKRESIEAGLRLWQWLADNPGKTKEDYFLRREIYEPLDLCYACEYAMQSLGSCESNYCKMCYLADLWGKSIICQGHNSVYDKWFTSRDSRGKKKFAQKIADYHKKLLEEIE